MKILAIESSCDETAIALIEARGGLGCPAFKIKKNAVISQVLIHSPYGGVVPNIAKREHAKNLPFLLKRVLGIDFCQKIDLLVVTVGPGLEPCLWEGINFANQAFQQIITCQKQKANRQKNSFTRLAGVNHLEGHLYSFLLSRKKTKFKFPAIHLLVSGGHTMLFLMRSLVDIEKLGETRDDAAGEAFDKVARMLKLPYPGGPEIEKIAKRGNPKSINFPRPMIYSKNFDLSFSGLKTSVFYYLRDLENKKIVKEQKKENKISQEEKANIAASFQRAAVDVLAHKTVQAVSKFEAKTVMISGGVAANKNFRSQFENFCKNLKIDFISAPIKFQTDNAVMIGIAAYINHLNNKKYELQARGGMSL